VNPPAGVGANECRNMVAVLEAFNGSRFYAQTGSAMRAGQWVTVDNGVPHHNIMPPAQQTALLQQAYAALRESVYAALVVQTRLKPYLDAIELVIDENGVSFDTAALTTLLQSQHATSPKVAIEDLLELFRFSNPRILILDEATSALDYESERIIQNNMKAIARGRTVIIVAHRLSAVRDANRIVVMERGQIVEMGTHAQLLQNPDGAYTALHKLQQG